jgi:hypothetical protein
MLMDSVTAAEIMRLETMTTSKLVEKFESVFGEKCRRRNKRYLIRRIDWRLQADAEEVHSHRIRKGLRRSRCVASLASEVTLDPRDITCSALWSPISGPNSRPFLRLAQPGLSKGCFRSLGRDLLRLASES